MPGKKTPVPGRADVLVILLLASIPPSSSSMGVGLYRLNLGGISVLGEDQLAFALLQSLNWGVELSK
ncbi:hypothetical protein [Candidatus Methylacidiphilum infernorum]|uniref:hypothetical protein n=1 Tax=Candidatus Methylacidiphilum infernorum TaxID=511746 RepID=UPI0011D07BE6|nr:hypothetical protein [Candidatus Methylacidiphilum infernorum]